MSSRTRIFVLFALLLLGATSMIAEGDYEIEFTYYTDASKNQSCGWRFLACDGKVYSAGCRTEWYDVYYYGPC